MKRTILLLACIAALAAISLATGDPNRITLPAAASIIGQAPFFSDVRVFNTSYTSTIAVTATYSIFNGGVLLGSQDRQIPPHSGVQINNIFSAINQASVATDNAIIVVKASGDLFSYAAVIDNNTTDPSFVLGAEDKPAPPGFTTAPGPTATPQPPVRTP